MNWTPDIGTVPSLSTSATSHSPIFHLCKLVPCPRGHGVALLRSICELSPYHHPTFATEPRPSASKPSRFKVPPEPKIASVSLFSSSFNPQVTSRTSNTSGSDPLVTNRVSRAPLHPSWRRQQAPGLNTDDLCPPSCKLTLDTCKLPARPDSNFHLDSELAHGTYHAATCNSWIASYLPATTAHSPEEYRMRHLLQTLLPLS